MQLWPAVSRAAALRHGKGDQLCHFSLKHVVEVPLGLLLMPAGLRAGAALSHKLGGKLLRCCKVNPGSAHHG